MGKHDQESAPVLCWAQNASFTEPSTVSHGWNLWCITTVLPSCGQRLALFV